MLFLFSAALRLCYPYEVEWNEGAVLDHAIRILHGMPIYSKPSIDFAAFVYTPLYYYLTAFFMMIGGVSLAAGRTISILATLATVWLIALIISRETRTMRSSRIFLPITGGMLYLAFYHLIGFFYDIVRMDALAVFLVVASLYTAQYAKRGHVISAILIAAAYFTKQQMVFAWPVLLLYFFGPQKRKAAWFATISIALVVFGTILMNVATHGWYSFYTYTIPSMKAAAGFSWRDALEFFPKTMTGSLGLFSFVILIMLIMTRAWMHDRFLLLLLGVGFCAVASASISLGNPGGYANVLMPLMAIIAILFPLALYHISNQFQSLSLLAPVLALVAFFSLSFNPLGEIMLFASTRQRQAGDEFISKLRAIPGDVWVPFHGYIPTFAGKTSHIHFMAMNDALVPHDARSSEFQRGIDSSLAALRFSAIILDEDRVYSWDSIPHYSEDGKFFEVPNVFLSRIGSAPTRPQFIYLPIR